MPTYDLGSSTFQLTIHSSFNSFQFWQLLNKYACQYLCYKCPNRASNILSCPAGFLYQLTFSALLTHQLFVSPLIIKMVSFGGCSLS